MPPVCRQAEPTHVEVRSLWRHGEAGGLGGILTTASKGGTVGKPVRLIVLKCLPIAVHRTLQEMKGGSDLHRYQKNNMRTIQRDKDTIHKIMLQHPHSLIGFRYDCIDMFET